MKGAGRIPSMLELTINGEARCVPEALSLADLLAQLGYDRGRIAVEVNRQIVPRPEHGTRQLAAGDEVEIVTLVGGGSPSPQEPPADKPLKVGKFTFQSRLFTGTGKFSTYDLMRDCLAASGCQVTTVAVRRERLIDKQGRSILDFLDLKRLTILPNTAGCFSAADAIRHARLARELLANLENPGADGVSDAPCVRRRAARVPGGADSAQDVRAGVQPDGGPDRCHSLKWPAKRPRAHCYDDWEYAGKTAIPRDCMRPGRRGPVRC